MFLKIKKIEDGIQFPTAIQPRASKNQVVGVHNSALKIRLTSPPIEGAANRLCVKFLGKFLGFNSSRILIARGLTRKNKIIQIKGNTEKSFLKELQLSV